MRNEFRKSMGVARVTTLGTVESRFACALRLRTMAPPVEYPGYVEQLTMGTYPRINEIGSGSPTFLMDGLVQFD